MDLLTSSPLFLIITCLSTYLVSFAYKKTKFVLKHKVFYIFTMLGQYFFQIFYKFCKIILNRWL